jgi:mitochondrial fission protein ELM1
MTAIESQRVETREGPEPSVWLLLDDRPGHRTQVRGLADALGWPAEERHLRFRVANHLPNRLLGASLASLDPARSDPLEPPWPDLVLAMGRRTVPVARWIGRQSGGKTKLVQLGRKGANLADAFDLSVALRHFQLPSHPARLDLVVPPTQVTAARLAEAAERWPDLLDDAASPKVVLLVGGATAQHMLTAEAAKEMAARVFSFAQAAGGSLTIVTSRRTGAKALGAMQAGAPAARFHVWRAEEVENPYLGYLARAEVLVATGESESMLAEAAATGLPLYIYPLEERRPSLKVRWKSFVFEQAGGSGLVAGLCRGLLSEGWLEPPRDLQRMHSELIDAGLAAPFGAPMTLDSRPAGWVEADKVTARIRELVTEDAANRGSAVMASPEVPPFRSPRSIWVVSSLALEAGLLAPLLEALIGRYPRVDLAVTLPAVETMAPGLPSATRPVSRPAGGLRSWRRALTVMDTRVVLHIGALAPADRAMLDAAAARAAPVILLDPALFDAAGRTALRGAEALLTRGGDNRAYVASPDARSALINGGMSDEQVEALSVKGPSAAGRAVAEAIREDMRRDQKLARTESQPLRRAAEAWLRRSYERGLLRRLFARRLARHDSIDDLRAALGEPETILCLGNGPSSADPALKEVAHDCLFRVNHLWLEGGLLTEADMIFTGGRGTIERVPSGIFGLLSRESEGRLLIHLLRKSLRSTIGLVTVERLGLFLNQPPWSDLRPTNGAAMLAVATALQPRRLVISGIDLFSHPAGTYPGDTATPNAYTPGHDAESELEILLAALSTYRGELVILSKALRTAWEARQAGNSSSTFTAGSGYRSIPSGD